MNNILRSKYIKNKKTKRIKRGGNKIHSRKKTHHIKKKHDKKKNTDKEKKHDKKKNSDKKKNTHKKKKYRRSVDKGGVKKSGVKNKLSMIDKLKTNTKAASKTINKKQKNSLKNKGINKAVAVKLSRIATRGVPPESARIASLSRRDSDPAHYLTIGKDNIIKSSAVNNAIVQHYSKYSHEGLSSNVFTHNTDELIAALYSISGSNGRPYQIPASRDEPLYKYVDRSGRVNFKINDPRPIFYAGVSSARDWLAQKTGASVKLLTTNISNKFSYLLDKIDQKLGNRIFHLSGDILNLIFKPPFKTGPGEITSEQVKNRDNEYEVLAVLYIMCIDAVALSVKRGNPNADIVHTLLWWSFNILLDRWSETIGDVIHLEDKPRGTPMVDDSDLD